MKKIIFLLLLISQFAFSQCVIDGTTVVGTTKTNTLKACNVNVTSLGNGLVKSTSGTLSNATAGTDYVTGSSTNTFTNKSGNISQWTNDAGYLTVGYTSSNGITAFSNNFKLGGTLTNNTEIAGAGYSLKLGTSASKLIELWGTSTDVVSWKVVNNGNKEFYADPTSLAMYYTDVSGSINASIEANSTRSYINWDNGTLSAILTLDGNGIGLSSELFAPYYAYLKTTNLTANRTYELPDISGTLLTDNSTATLTNKSGNISQWTNDAGYLTTVSGYMPTSAANDVSIASSAGGPIGEYVPRRTTTIYGPNWNNLRTYTGGTYSNPSSFSSLMQSPSSMYLNSGTSSLATYSELVLDASGFATFRTTGSQNYFGLNTNGAGYAKIKSDSITTDKTFNFPNISGTLLTNNSYATLTNKTWNGLVIGSSYGGAGTTNGLLKANGSGTVSAAVAGTDYVAPGALGSYLPLSGGTMSGDITVATNKIKNSIDPGNYLLVGASSVDLVANSDIYQSSQQNIELNAVNNIQLTGANVAIGSNTIYDNSNERFGVGTTSPEAAFSIEGKFQASKMWSVRNHGKLYSHQIVDTANNIYGVGLLNKTYLAIENSETSQDPQLRLSSDSLNGVASVYSYWSSDNTKKHKLQLKSSGDLILLNTNNDNLIHTSTGNIGLGTSNPGSSQPSGSDAGGKILELNSASPSKDIIVSMVGNSSAVSADWWLDRSAGNVYFDNRYDATSAKIGIRLRTSGTPVEALSLWGTGDLGVGLTTTPAARLHLLSTTSQLRTAYDASNYMSLTTASTGSTTLALTGTSPKFTFSNQVDVSSALTCTGILTTNGSNISAANFTVVGNTTAGTTGNNSQLLFSGASNMAYRVLERNSTTYTLPTGVAYAGHIIGEQPVTTFTSGSHPMISSLVIKPPTVTNGGATTDTTATVYITGSGTAGSQNYSLRVNGTSSFSGTINGTTTGNALAPTISADATDADYTAVVNSVKYLPASTLTTDRTITIPTGTNGDFLEIYNNETAYNWNLSGASVYLADGVTTLTALYANTNHLIRKVSGKWRILN